MLNLGESMRNGHSYAVPRSVIYMKFLGVGQYIRSLKQILILFEPVKFPLLIILPSEKPRVQRHMQIFTYKDN